MRNLLEILNYYKKHGCTFTFKINDNSDLFIGVHLKKAAKGKQNHFKSQTVLKELFLVKKTTGKIREVF